MFCFVIYGSNIYVSKLKFNSFEKNVWYSNDFGGFWWKFSMILADFCYPDPDPTDQNETDPDPQHCFKVIKWKSIFKSEPKINYLF